VLVADREWLKRTAGQVETPPPGIEFTVPHISRVYNYWLGGKDNFAADRKLGDETVANYPAIREGVRGVRAFLGRTVRYLAAEMGIRQFLDIGTGLPTDDNTHGVAQSVAPESRVVYVDNDPIVIAHARALLTSATGACAYISADAREPQRILTEAASTLDFTQPVAVMLVSLMHLIPDESDPYGIVAALVDAVPSGSYLALSHMASDIDVARTSDVRARLNRVLIEQHTFRTRDQVTRFFDGLDLVEPGIVRLPEWRPDSAADVSNPVPQWGGVARKR
jgi:S-adenosyl methyltransferase